MGDLLPVVLATPWLSLSQVNRAMTCCHGLRNSMPRSVCIINMSKRSWGSSRLRSPLRTYWEEKPNVSDALLRRVLQQFPAVEALILCGQATGSLASIEPCARCLGLKDLEMSNCAVLSIAASLPPFLRKLNLGFSKIRDISALGAQCPVLEELKVAHTLVADLSTLAHCLDLQVLDIGYTSVDTLEPLRHCSRLKELFLPRTQVDTIAPCARLRELKILDLQRTKVSDLSPLRGNHAELQRLYLGYTTVIDLTPLSSCSELTTLHLSFTPVRRVRVLFFFLIVPHVRQCVPPLQA